MAYRAWNKAPAAVKRRYFELIRQGASGAAASQQVGVSLSCGSLWFIDAGSVTFIDKPISSRYLTQDDRIEIADGLAARESVKSIAARISKSYQSVYREITRNRKPDGRYQPWYAHGQAHLRRRRARPRRVSVDDELRAAITGKLAVHWSPAQISRVVAAAVAQAQELAAMSRDDLRVRLPRSDRLCRPADAADRSHLPAQARTRS